MIQQHANQYINIYTSQPDVAILLSLRMHKVQNRRTVRTDPSNKQIERVEQASTANTEYEVITKVLNNARDSLGFSLAHIRVYNINLYCCRDLSPAGMSKQGIYQLLPQSLSNKSLQTVRKHSTGQQRPSRRVICSRVEQQSQAPLEPLPAARTPVLILPGFLSNNTVAKGSQYQEMAVNLLELGHPAAGVMMHIWQCIHSTRCFA